MNKIKVIILANELDEDHLPWAIACMEYKEQIEYRVIDLTKDTWLNEIQSLPFDLLLAKPGGLTAHFKQLYDERIYILGKVLNYWIYPSPEEIFIYENKRFLSYWLKSTQIPHPETHVFNNKNEAGNFLNRSDYPIVTKTNIGASGSGVKILKNKKAASNYIIRSFSAKGAPERTGPNLDRGDMLKRALHYFTNPRDIAKKLKIYKTRNKNRQRNFVIFQEYIPHSFEWRVVRIGESFFAHKKITNRSKASGTLLKGYENPPIKLLNFVKNITDKHRFFSQAVDVFESERGYLVNEMQCIFGQSDPYQMLIDGKPGRYLYIDNRWVFEEGDFASNQCYNLRLDYILNLLK